ncbi:hypothetical protein QUF88_27470 [Bacillus sp. DX1.1]|uniref:hypothetical protein n=1 Tax=unclassified Bacillus (in: firmicutes) TaxID=185979 RepID=UPI002570A4A2|nr:MULTISPECIES: hypothetical protein [unclassified Bacillus (in: firmicutes)]MDM5157422.1 hypothetical protein [Bacillus sp. DX1.1]WJE81644.1 hypothetical protein QRE67_25010 [Bacillus sp. DX3.1]
MVEYRAEEKAIVLTILSFASMLQLPVVAEGIETTEQLQFNHFLIYRFWIKIPFFPIEKHLQLVVTSTYDSGGCFILVSLYWVTLNN